MSFYQVYIIAILITMYVDAVTTHAKGDRYEWFASYMIALFWPITCVAAIIAVVSIQEGEDSE